MIHAEVIFASIAASDWAIRGRSVNAVMIKDTVMLDAVRPIGPPTKGTVVHVVLPPSRE